jgi:hypothetical protein
MGARHRFRVMDLHVILTCVPALLAALTLSACGGEEGVGPAPPPIASRRLSLARVLGTYSGSMLTVSGVEAVMVEIQEVVPLGEGLTFRYRMNVRDLREDGFGTLRIEGSTTRVCFSAEVCGWLLAEDDRVLIAAETQPGELLPACSMEKQ